MTSSDYVRNGLSVCCVLALLVGCGGSQMPIGTPGAMPQSRGKLQHVRDALLYASESVFEYPSGKFIGKLSGFDEGFAPLGLCSDEAGDVFITGVAHRKGQIYEFEHGGQMPIRELTDRAFASSCSVNPVTGDLAVANSGYGQFKHGILGSIALFSKASGEPTYYNYSKEFMFCSYDNRGDLFISEPDGGRSTRTGCLPAACNGLETNS